MSTYVHPDTENAAFLERFFGVPPGTDAEWSAWRSREPVPLDRHPTDEESAAWSRWDRSATPAVARFDAFKDQGLGSLRAHDALRAAGLDPVVGETADPDLVRVLLATAFRRPNPAVTAEEVAAAGGLAWY